MSCSKLYQFVTSYNLEILAFKYPNLPQLSKALERPTAATSFTSTKVGKCLWNNIIVLKAAECLSGVLTVSAFWQISTTNINRHKTLIFLIHTIRAHPLKIQSTVTERYDPFKETTHTGNKHTSSCRLVYQRESSEIREARLWICILSPPRGVFSSFPL